MVHIWLCQIWIINNNNYNDTLRELPFSFFLDIISFDLDTFGLKKLVFQVTQTPHTCKKKRAQWHYKL